MKSVVRSLIVRDASADSFGLSHIAMSNLSPIVVLAGPNGAGKTRILSTLKKAILDKTKLDVERDRTVGTFRSSVQRQILRIKNDQRRGDRKSQAASMDLLSSLLRLDDLGPRTKSRVFDQILSSKLRYSEISQSIINDLFPDGRMPTPSNVPNVFVTMPEPDVDVIEVPSYPPDTALISDERRAERKVLKKSLGSVRTQRISFDQSMRVIQSIFDAFIDSTHPMNKINDDEKITFWKNRWNALKLLFSELLYISLDYNNEKEVTIRDEPLDQIKLTLSPGQMKIVQFIASLFDTSGYSKNTVLIFDEPENHLHPAAANRVIRRLSDILDDGQIWIATHSVSLISALDDAQVWYVVDGQATISGRDASRVVAGLLGGEENVEKLRAFLDQPDILAVTRFSYESLFIPGALNLKSGDPQFIDFGSWFLAGEASGGPRKVLDWGAGKGRLAEWIATESQVSTDKISYFAFDKYGSDSISCKSAIKRLHPDGVERYYDNYSSLYDRFCDDKFDIVVLCNVLHEIDPTKWKEVFSSHNGISKIISPEGYLVIIEDLHISHGELAHEYGFVILNAAGIRKLFGLADAELLVLSPKDEKFAARLKTFVVPGRSVGTISAASVAAAMEETYENAAREIERLRGKPDPSAKDGRLLALYLQQYANSRLWKDKNT